MAGIRLDLITEEAATDRSVTSPVNYMCKYPTFLGATRIYKKLITVHAKQNTIPLIEVDSRDTLGKWVGRCKFDKAGEARRVKGCSSCAIKNYGEESEAYTYLEQYIKEHNL